MKDKIKLPDQAEYCAKFSRTFKNLSPAELDLLFNHNLAEVFKRGEIIYSEGARMQGCYFIYSGVVKIFQTGEGGKEQIIKLEKEGDFFGFRSVILKEKACTSVEVLDNALLYFIPESILFQLIKNNPDFAYELMQIACKELGESNRHIKDIAQKTVKERLAEILLMMARDFGIEPDGTLKLTISREDLGNFIGTATETVIRLMTEFKAEGLIESQRLKIKLLDIPKLQKRAGK